MSQSQITPSIVGNSMNIDGLNVRVLNKIADGGYGRIYRCIDDEGKEYALKEIFCSNKDVYNASLNEFSTHLSVCFDPHIVQVFGHYEKGNKFYFLMEMCPGSLVSYMNDHFTEHFTDDEVVKIFTCIVEAVNTLHEKSPPIIHRDLKIENVLNNGTTWKLCDFGSATKTIYQIENESMRKLVNEDITKNTTPNYRAPEEVDLFRGDEIGTKVDIWALGCILYKLITFKDAFPADATLQILQCKVQFSSDFNPIFKHIIESCFAPHPNERPTAFQLLGMLHKYFPNLVDSKYPDFDIQPKENKTFRSSSVEEQLEFFSKFNVRFSSSSVSGDSNDSKTVTPKSTLQIQNFEFDNENSSPVQKNDPFSSFGSKSSINDQPPVDPFESFGYVEQNSETKEDPFASFGNSSQSTNLTNDPFSSFGNPSTNVSNSSDPFSTPK